ncbi:MAG: carboxylesterase family protein [Streptomycetaceae bacterium]|nr:carboxylesterase family protein [Streptomycetaceae bacterium]
MTAVDAVDVVEAPAGRVVGRRTGRVRRFLGIPFTEAPVGARRFTAPVPRGRFTQPFDASRHGATSQRVPLFATTTIPQPSVPGDDVLAREYGRPGAMPAADTTGVFDSVVVW